MEKYEALREFQQNCLNELVLEEAVMTADPPASFPREFSDCLNANAQRSSSFEFLYAQVFVWCISLRLSTFYEKFNGERAVSTASIFAAHVLQKWRQNLLSGDFSIHKDTENAIVLMAAIKNSRNEYCSRILDALQAKKFRMERDLLDGIIALKTNQASMDHSIEDNAAVPATEYFDMVNNSLVTACRNQIKEMFRNLADLDSLCAKDRLHLLFTDGGNSCTVQSLAI